MIWQTLVFHPLARSVGTLALVALLGLMLSAIRERVGDEAMAAIDAVEAAQFDGDPSLRLEMSAPPVSQVSASPEAEAGYVVEAVTRCQQRPKKVRVAPVGI